VWIASSLSNVLTPTAVALGNFDGVHRGHQQVIHPIFQHQLATAPGIKTGIPSHPPGDAYSTVVTFYPHPQEFFSGQSKKLLTPALEKTIILENMGVDQLVLLPFDRDLANLSPDQFVEEILVQGLQAKSVSVGADFRFGKERSGTVQDLRAIASQYDMKVAIQSIFTCENGERISSSIIRELLQRGDIQRANHLLGRCYSLVGPVVAGQKLARQLGFPTANIQLPQEKFLPRFGVYAVQVMIDEKSGENNSENLIPGVMNIGNRPTVDGQVITAEVHLLNWKGDLYGKQITVNLCHYLRTEQKFASFEVLRQQIAQDCQTALEYFQGNFTHVKS